ncbi:hypothetical protein P7D85_09510 [Enterococcus hulanensis]|uniref:Uncharacterized protein n=1 Tax=Enterococcus hulanensis TaxID=2559929 RepID=A0ABU3EYR3_9ENTE|nr:hypothetical protein [Enterococcus hulanensis]MDT2600013.1 hypothetical protein [Enterococcus hulanensis]MDT2610087.1 hypothetical protein [Enterococcus hulanensis]MDT2617895.1 hypothetical protein [Enterococcus hulanensis]MDT2629865.1 hypothetical protein [Enterococcus hulanensis]MDT2656460.1 hypothetical protein [Enterococcus hulanensis]
MEIKQLTRRQLFTMKNRKNLETKVRKFWEATKNADLVVEYFVAIIVRNALVASDFSLPCQDVVRDLLFQAEPSETLRQFSPFFKDYLDESEWISVIKRLFKNENAYYKATKKMRVHKNSLKNRGSAVLVDNYDSYTLVSIFEDTNGKKHTWKLRDADPSNTLEETKRILNILTTLTIFQKDDVRQFAKFLDCEFKGTTTLYSTKQPKEQEQSVQNSVAEPTKTKADTSSEKVLVDGMDLSVLTKGELIILLKGIFEEAEAAMLEESSDKAEEGFEKLPADLPIGNKTNIESRIVPEEKGNQQQEPLSTLEKPKSDLIPTLAAGAILEEGTEKPPKVDTPVKPNGKKLSKKDRKLLDNFNQRKKKPRK